MKKGLVLLGLAGVLAFSATALAQWGSTSTWYATTAFGPNPGDGLGQVDGVIDGYGYANGIPGVETRTEPSPYMWPFGPQYDDQGELIVPPQVTELALDLIADNPCFLWMRFWGNNVNASLLSIGPEKASLSWGPQQFAITFFPSLSGLVNENWVYQEGSLSPGPLPSIPPPAGIPPIPMSVGYYIRSCDVYPVDLWSNMDYKYSVKVDDGCLLGPSPDDSFSLPIQMRSHTDMNADYSLLVSKADVLAMGTWNQPTVDFSDPSLDDYTVEVFDTVPALTFARAIHQFRVPLTPTIPAGTYWGKVTFTAATI